MNLEKVLDVKHYTDNLFYFKTTKSEAWKEKNFTPGEFTMIGMGDEKLTRAYSIANSPQDDYLEFLSIKVEGGPLTSRLKNIKVDDKIEVTVKPIGTLLLRNLDPEPCINDNGRLWLISTGTGLAPFLSIARHYEAYDYYKEIIVTHTCRTNDELVFRPELEKFGAKVWQSVTRESPTGLAHKGRVTDAIADGSLFDALEIKQKWFDIKYDRIMICGNIDFNNEIRDMLEEKGWEHGTMRSPGQFVQEKAFVG